MQFYDELDVARVDAIFILMMTSDFSYVGIYDGFPCDTGWFTLLDKVVGKPHTAHPERCCCTISADV